MRRRDISKVLLATAAGTAALIAPQTRVQAQSCTPPCYPQTAREAALSITPADPSYPPGCVNRYTINSSPGVTDMTMAIQRAISVSPDAFALAETYLITDSIKFINLGAYRQRFLGAGQGTVLLNKAAANRPTVLIDSVQYLEIGEFCIAGAAGFPNDAIYINSNTPSSNTSGFIEVRRIVMEPNGNGIHLKQVNTVRFHHVDYWPSGLYGIATADAGTRKFAVYTDAGASGDYFNDLHFDFCNMVGVDTSIPGHAVFRLWSPALGNCDLITINNCELEGTGLTVGLFTNCMNVKLNGCFLENGAISMSSCRYSAIDNCYALLNFTATSCVQAMLRGLVMNGTASFDSACDSCGAQDSTIQTYTNNSARAVTLNVISSVSGVAGYMRDRIGAVGVTLNSLPTSSAGLPTGALWNSAGTVKIV